MAETLVAHGHEPVASNPTTRFERKDANLGAVLLCGGVLVVIGVVVLLVSWWIFDVLQARDRRAKISPFPLAVQERGQLPPEPRLEQVDRMGGKNPDEGGLYATEQRRLQNYGWVDEKTGIVHLPIERAMQVIVEQQRLPARPSAPRP